MNQFSEKKLLVVVAKEPVAGQVKTRLSPAFAPEEAASLYRCMIADRLQEMGGLDGTDLAVAFTPASAAKAFISLAPLGFDFFPQRGFDLGERLHNIFVDAFADGYGAVSIIDSDSPDLAKAIVMESFDHLLENGSDVVFGPACDGGYYLVGMRKPHPELFENISWSTGTVLEDTLRKNSGLGLKTALLPWGNDLDTFEDLLGFYKKYNGEKELTNRPGKKTFTFLSRMKIIRNNAITRGDSP